MKHYALRVNRKKAIILCLAVLALCTTRATASAPPRDSISSGNDPLPVRNIDMEDKTRERIPLFRRPLFIEAKYAGGTVLPTDDALRGENKIPYAQFGEVKLGFNAIGDRWQDIYYDMPYYGLGVGVYDFNRSDMGTPVSIFLLQGGNLAPISQSVRLKYEWNLGMSLNWNPYDPIDNPRNACIGGKVCVYVAANIYFSWMVSERLDLNAGAFFNHVSNGAMKYPNSGINTVGGYVSAAYNFNRERIAPNYSLLPPHFEPRFVSDFNVFATSRQRKYSKQLSGLRSSEIDHDFFVMGMSYSLLYMPSHRYRFGLALDGIYDEGADFTAVKTGETPEGRELVDVKYGKVEDRFSLGVSVQGEWVQSLFEISAKIGIDMIHAKIDDPRFYQAIGIKIPVSDGLYGSFTIRSKRFAKAQYLFFGLGYRINHGQKASRK